ncbi:MAG: hypothetical protein KDD22_01840 [Bdellovibrionales bacterium]|nr:hypothetical protein [Bdellovibrionales bacterium]
MKKIKNILAQLWKDESAQGATEYILLLVVFVGLAMLFKDKIKGIVSDKLSELEAGVKGVTSN